MKNPSSKYLHGRSSTFGVPMNAASERARYESTSPASALVCAWCGVTMRAGAEPVSHGICPICAVKFEQGDIA